MTLFGHSTTVFRFDKGLLAVIGCQALFIACAVILNFEYTMMIFAMVVLVIIALMHSRPDIFLVGLAVVVFCVIWSAYSESPLLPFAQDGFLALSFFIFTAHVVEGQNKSIEWKGMTTAIGLFLAVICLAAIIGFSQGRNPKLIVLELHMLSYFVFYFVLLAGFRTIDDAKYLLKLVFFGGVVACLQYIGILLASGKFHRVATYHADMFPLLLSFSVALSAFASKRSVRIAALCMSVLFVCGLIISLTRAEWAAAALSLTVLGFFLLKGKKIKLRSVVMIVGLILGLGGVVLVLAPDAVSNLVESKSTQQITKRAESFSNTGQDVSLLMRVELDYAAFQRFRQYPVFGAGLGDMVSYKVFSSEHIWGLDSSHLYVLWKMGLVGFLVYGTVIVLILRRSYFVFCNTKEIFFTWFSAGLFSGVCGLILLSFFSSALTKYNLNLTWAISLAIVEFGALRIGEINGK